ncbi:MAG: hypothetical protein J6R89_07025, partial [Clostridia bacterium]|nr:hypothetical protein [Clostridia bacterium]
ILTVQQMIDGFNGVRDAMKKPGGINLVGIYVEGPYMNPKYGASPEKNKWRGEIKEEAYCDLVNEAGDLAKVWAIAPEREGMESFWPTSKRSIPMQ